MAEPATGPSLMRRCVADLVALGIGAGVSWFGTEGAFKAFSRSEGVLVVAAFAIVWGGAPFVGAGVRDAILRRGGAVLPPARTPRNFRGVLAWFVSFVLGAAPAVGLFSWLLSGRDSIAPGLPMATIQVAALVAFITGPTVGLLVARGLCRRWSAPPTSSPPTPAGSPAPAPTPLPARPADDPPAPQFLPSPA
jgi:hypothetical protein